MTEHDVAASLSNAAYELSNGVRLGVSAKEAAEAALFRQRQRIIHFLQSGRGTTTQRLRAVDMLERLRSMRVVKADENNFAIARQNSVGGKEVQIASVGTRFGTKDQWKDLAVDAKVAFNAKNIKRLDEARQFAKEVVEQEKVANSNLHFTGHRCVWCLTLVLFDTILAVWEDSLRKECQTTLQDPELWCFLAAVRSWARETRLTHSPQELSCKGVLKRSYLTLFSLRKKVAPWCSDICKVRKTQRL